MGIAPVVMNNLNVVENLHHHYKSFGGWTFIFQDYYKMNVTLMLDEPKTQKIFDIIDMYVFGAVILNWSMDISSI